MTFGDRRRRFTEQQCASVNILSDDIVENVENFTLMISTEDSDVILDPSSATVLILNNDCEQLLVKL